MIMNVSLTPQLESLVKQKVDSGLYNSASEVIREALRLLEEYEDNRARRLSILRKSIQDGLESGEASPLNMQGIKTKARKNYK
jgi:antitoxin ParD1/3/4